MIAARKKNLLAGLLLVVILGALYGVYHFYFRAQLTEYADNRQYLQQLDEKLTALEDMFDRTQPDVYLAKVRGEVQPWREALDARGTYFHMGDSFEVNPVPEGALAKFYYEEQFNRQLDQLNYDAWMRQCTIPQITFGAPNPGQLSGQVVTAAEVEKWLKDIRYGESVTRMLLDANARAVDEISIWPPRLEHDVLEMYTVGLSFFIAYGDLGKFLDKLSREDRFFTVNALSIQNQNLSSYYEPLLKVDMLLTQAQLYQPPVKQDEMSPETLMETLRLKQQPKKLDAEDLRDLELQARRKRSVWKTLRKWFWPF